MNKYNLRAINLNKIELNTIKNIVNKNIFEYLQPNKTLLNLFNKYEFGTINNKYQISFNDSEIQVLKNISKEKIEHNRKTAQLNNENEKASRFKKVHIDEILIKSSNDKILINNEIFSSPFNSPILINYNKIHTVEHKQIIVIENYECFLHYHNFDDDYLVIYRGESKYNLKHVLAFLKKINKKIFVFTDFDPAGLTNIYKTFSNTIEVQLYIPKSNIPIEALFDKFGRKDLYLKQLILLDSLNNLKKEISDKNWLKIYDLILGIKLGLPQEIFVDKNI